MWASFQQRKPALLAWYTSHFPAINLKRKLDSWDYAFNFSSEMLASALVLLVVVANVFTFGFFSSSEHDFSDNSLAGRFLSYHIALNSPLYNKQNSIKTTVVKQDGFIASAFASDDPLSAVDSQDSDGNTETAEISDSVIEAPNPDTVRELLNKQITIYKTKQGDTLGAVARECNNNIDTVKWANRLSDNTIKPDWYIKCLPVNGVLYQATSNDTLPDVARAFSGNLETIISYNGLGGPEDIDAGQWIIIPGGSMPAPKPKPGATTFGAPVVRIPPGEGHIFPKGYCTAYVASRVKITFGGNARNWLTNAKKAGYTTGSKPAAGAVGVTTEDPRYGHVFYVEKVVGDSIVVSEMNYVGWNKKSTRTIPINSSVIRGYIYTR